VNERIFLLLKPFPDLQYRFDFFLTSSNKEKWKKLLEKQKLENEENEENGRSEKENSPTRDSKKREVIDLISGEKKMERKRKKPRLSLPTPSKLPLSNISSPDEKDDGKIRCCICQNKPIKPHKAKCKHLCCLECWERWLKNKLECPVCRARVRIRQIKPTYLV